MNNNQPTTAIRQVKIGSLVGMGPNSTCQFYNAVIEYARILDNARFDIDFPEIIMISSPTPFYPDKAIDDNDMIDKLMYGINILNKVSVDFISIPCNIVHKYYNFMQKISKVSIMNIISITINEVKVMNPNKVGFIATSSTISSKLYQETAFLNEIELFHTNELQLKVTNLLIELKLFKLSTKAISLWNEIIDYIESNNCTHCIIACTDISICKDIRSTNIEFIDSNDVLARQTIIKYMELKYLNLEKT